MEVHDFSYQDNTIFFVLFQANDEQNVNKLLFDAFQLHLPTQKNFQQFCLFMFVCVCVFWFQEIAQNC